jgi:hypothetical protein
MKLFRRTRFRWRRGVAVRWQMRALQHESEHELMQAVLAYRKAADWYLAARQLADGRFEELYCRGQVAACRSLAEHISKKWSACSKKPAGPSSR